MEKLGYHHNAIARSLVSRSSRTIGLIMSRAASLALLNPFFPEVIRGISDAAQPAQYHLLLSSSPTHAEERQEALAMLRHRRVDGVILLASWLNDQLIHDLLREEFPFVVVGRVPGHDDLPAVNNDNVRAAELAVDHLLDLGYSEVAFVAGDPNLVVTADRLEGYRTALGRRGIPFRPDWVVYTEFSVEGGGRALDRLWEAKPKPRAVFATDDILAIGLIQAAKARGLRVPEDVAVVGFNDSAAAPWLDPPLTTVRIPIYEMGRTAASLLIDLMQGRPVKSVVLPAELAVRRSCGAPPRN